METLTNIYSVFIHRGRVKFSILSSLLKGKRTLSSFLFQVFTFKGPSPITEPVDCWREPVVAQAALPQALGCKKGSELHASLWDSCLRVRSDHRMWVRLDFSRDRAESRSQGLGG